MSIKEDRWFHRSLLLCSPNVYLSMDSFYFYPTGLPLSFYPHSFILHCVFFYIFFFRFRLSTYFPSYSEGVGEEPDGLPRKTSGRKPRNDINKEYTEREIKGWGEGGLYFPRGIPGMFGLARIRSSNSTGVLDRESNAFSSCAIMLLPASSLGPIYFFLPPLVVFFSPLLTSFFFFHPSLFLPLAQFLFTVTRRHVRNVHA